MRFMEKREAGAQAKSRQAGLPAVFPRGVGDRERPEIFAANGFDDFQQYDGMIAIFFANVDNLTLDVGANISQDGRRRLAGRKGLAVQRTVLALGWGEEFLGHVPLIAGENVESGDAASGQTVKHVAAPSNRGHEERWLEGSLRNPGDGGDAEAITGARGQHVDAVREQAQRFLPGLRVHAFAHFTAARSRFPGHFRKNSGLAERSQYPRRARRLSFYFEQVSLRASR